MSKNQVAGQDGDKGVILFTSSVAAEEASRGGAGYGSSKGAINGLLIPMARDLGKYNIRVAAIAPGIFETPMFNKGSKAIKKFGIMSTPMKRLGMPEEFAHMVNFIVENGYINGVSMRIDGAIKIAHL